MLANNLDQIDPDFADSIYKGGYNAGVKHTNPSEITKEILSECVKKNECQLKADNCYNNNIKPIMEKMEKMDDKIDNIQIQIASLPEALIEKLDKRYASKVTENIVYAGAGLILTAFIMALWELIKK